MNQMSERELREAVIATKKDVKLIAAAKNDRINSPASLYAEFAKLPVERRREIINTISNDHFTAAQWKIAFPLNNFPAPLLPDAVKAAGKALFFTRDEAAVRGVVNVLKTYQQSPFFSQVAAIVGDAAETLGEHVDAVARILVAPAIYGLIQSLDPSADNASKIVAAVVKVATYTKDLDSTESVAKFLQARRYSTTLGSLAEVVENTIFLARDRKSVKEILSGFNSAAIDVLLQRAAASKQLLSQIQDVAWKTRDADAIREYLTSISR